MLKLQSAIEYLITYGWAILIIAIVLVTLFELGLFTPKPIKQCVIEAGFSCSNYYLNSQGVLTFTLKQQTSNPVNITGIACYENGTLLSGQAPYNPPTNEVFMPVGTSYTFYAQCYSSNTIPFSGNIGDYFTGSVAIYYKDAITHLTELAVGSLTVPVSTDTPTLLSANPDTENSIKITIINIASNTVPQNFQQELSINPSAFAQYGLNQNMSNLIFTTGAYGSGSPIDAWIESGASNTATNSIIWLNLPSSISPNGGTETVYMSFLTDNTPVASGYTGYAPQLYCASGCFQTTYAEYDNGNNVFPVYFNANTLLSRFTTYDVGTLSQTTLNGEPVISIVGDSIFGYGWAGFSNPIPSSFIIDGWIYTTQSSDIVGFTSQASTLGNGYLFGAGTGAGDTYVSISKMTSGSVSNLANSGPENANNWEYVQISYNNGAMNMQGGTSPSNFLYSISATDTSYTSGYVGIAESGNTGNNYYRYMFVRAYPPEGKMPIVSCSVGICNN
ncbi:MAG: hypothetical protein ACP5M9_01585 [Candidatus Micrarchaeia archaeon]